MRRIAVCLTIRGGLLVPQNLDQLCPTAGKARAHRTNGNALDGRNLFIFKVCDMAKDQSGAVFLGDVSKCRHHIELGSDGFGAIVLRRVVHDVVVRWTRTATNASNFVERGIGGDAIDPGGELRSAVEGRKRFHNRDQRILRGVFCIRPINHDSVTHGPNSVVMETQESVGGSPIASFGAANEEIIFSTCDIPRLATWVELLFRGGETEI